MSSRVVNKINTVVLLHRQYSFNLILNIIIILIVVVILVIDIIIPKSKAIENNMYS